MVIGSLVGYFAQIPSGYSLSVYGSIIAFIALIVINSKHYDDEGNEVPGESGGVIGLFIIIVISFGILCLIFFVIFLVTFAVISYFFGIFLFIYLGPLVLFLSGIISFIVGFIMANEEYEKKSSTGESHWGDYGPSYSWETTYYYDSKGKKTGYSERRVRDD